jgi:hypothetical protein
MFCPQCGYQFDVVEKPKVDIDGIEKVCLLQREDYKGDDLIDSFCSDELTEHNCPACNFKLFVLAGTENNC